jgi:hypothetical protein
MHAARLLRLGRRFQFDGQGTWIRQRDPWLAVTGSHATPEFLELDHHVVPAMKHGRPYRVLRRDDPDSGPREAAKGRPIGISRDDYQASFMPGVPGVRDRHPDQIRYFDLTGVTRPSTLHSTLRRACSL